MIAKKQGINKPQLILATAIITIIMLLIQPANAEEYAVNNGITIPNETIGLESTTIDSYNWETAGTAYTARFKNGFNWGDAIYFTAGTGEQAVILSPLSLRYRDSNDADNYKTGSAGATLVHDNDTVTYTGAFGTGRDIRYTMDSLQLKEDLIINTRSDLPEPDSWFVNNAPNGEVFFTMDFQVKIDGNIEYEGETRTTNGGYTATNESIIFTHSTTGEELYRITDPIAIDANGDEVRAEYFLNQQNDPYVLEIRVPYEWLDTATYPVRIDPTFEIDYSPIPGELLSNGLVLTENDNEFSAVSDVTTTLSDNNTATNIEVARNVRTSLAYDALDSPGGTNINAQTATAGDGQIAVTNTNPQIITTTPIRDASRLLLRIAPNTGGAPGTQYLVQNTAATETYASFTLSSTKGVFQNYDLFLSGIPEGGVNQIQLVEQKGSGSMQLDYIEVLGNDRNQGDAVSGHWTQTYDDQWNWWLRVYKNTSDIHEATVTAYADNTNISNQTVTATLAGSGWFNINVSSLMEWQLANTTLNSTDLRYYTEESSGLSELLLRQEGNDSTPPSIGTCTANNSVIYDGESATINCPVTDNLDVDTVTGNFGGNNVLFSQIGTTGNYQYEYTCNAIGEDQNEPLSLVNATDIVGLSSTTSTAVNINCKRHCDYKGSGPWNIIKQFSCETSTAFSDFGNAWNVNNYEQTNITSNVSNFSTLNVSSNSTVEITGGTTVTIG